MADELTISEAGDPQRHPYGVLLQTGLRRALAGQHKVPEFLFAIQGMSGRIYRAMINTIVAGMPDARYLEVGSWAGSTCCAAIYGNRVRAVCIDNWSLFGGPRDKFFANTARCTNDGVSLTCIENDFRQVDYTQIGTHNIYLFDGPHERQDQEDGIRVAQPALDDIHLLIVDDWNWKKVRDGTFDGIRLSGLEILYSIEVRTTQNNALPELRREKSDWHNGYFLGIVRKTQQAVATGS